MEGGEIVLRLSAYYLVLYHTGEHLMREHIPENIGKDNVKQNAAYCYCS